VAKVRIRILDDTFEAQAQDSILRALQMYGLERNLPAYGFTRFCWNARCKQCILDFDCDGRSQRDFACQTEVQEGLQVKSLPEVLMWTVKMKK
jgi:predicted molibdopterin-dependent oxidoreductase YjgC